MYVRYVYVHAVWRACIYVVEEEEVGYGWWRFCGICCAKSVIIHTHTVHRSPSLKSSPSLSLSLSISLSLSLFSDLRDIRRRGEERRERREAEKKSKERLFLCKAMGDVAKDLLAGTMGGVAQLLVGHPFDTIKVKLQSQPAPSPGVAPKYSGAIDAVKQTLAQEGPRGLYKGMGAPLATVAAFNAVLFTARGQMEALLRGGGGGGSGDKSTALSIRQQMVCGAGAGLAVSFLACPTELIKCRLQAQGNVSSAGATGAVGAAGAAGAGAGAVSAVRYNGPMDVARHVLRSEGGVLGLFRGLTPTLLREVPGNAAMFGVYEATKTALARSQPDPEQPLGRGSLLAAGGFAGATFWFSVYPADVVKSVIQVDDRRNPKYSGTLDAFRKVFRSEGVKGLYKGFGPAMARSVPANAACFLAYEIVRSNLG